MKRTGRRVLVTHADQPLGRRLVRALLDDRRVERVWAMGSGRPPRALEHALRVPDGRLRWTTLDLARHRSVADVFHSPEWRAAAIDSVVHVPRHAAPPASPGPPLWAGVCERTAEARLLLQHCLESPQVRQIVALGSAFVYRLEPGNANRLTEDSELDLDPQVAPELRSWIDCDMIFHGEVHNARVRVAVLRVPTVVTAEGDVYLHPGLEGPSTARPRPLGFDPLCALLAEEDLTDAVRAALHRRRRGVFNVAGAEAVPLSVLVRWAGGWSVPLPGGWLHGAATAAEWLGREGWRTRLDGAHLRYGFTLDTRRAERELGFRPGHRIGLSRTGTGRWRVETAPA